MSNEQFLASLEVKCEPCSGTGYVIKQYRDERPYQAMCEACKARGHVPSEFGEAVLAFVKRNVSFTVTTHLK